MEIDLLVIGIIVAGGAGLLGWLIWRNLKDKRDFEKSSNLSELKPDLHKPDKI